jgi:hypothetical protein
MVHAACAFRPTAGSRCLPAMLIDFHGSPRRFNTPSIPNALPLLSADSSFQSIGTETGAF